MRANDLKRKLEAGQPSTGCWLFSGSVPTAEILALCGFDALVIDLEHSPGGIETMVDQLRAIETTSTTPLVRLAELTDSSVKLALDAGATGLLVPNVETAAQARDLFQAATYPPEGRRGAHFTVSRAARWGLDGASYYRKAKNELLLIAMIESESAVAAIPEMARKGGIDMFFIGPLDLSASIGTMGNYKDPAFVQLLDEAERRIRESGKWLGGATMPEDGLRNLYAREYSFVTFTSDVAILRDKGIEMAMSASQTVAPAREGS